MGISWGNRLLAAAATLLLAGSMVSAQQSASDTNKRKIKVKTNPVYSELAHRMNLSGKVKIEVVIAPDGHVKTLRPVGGHPLLIQCCLDALKDWKFEPGPEDTTEIFEFDFKAE